MSITQQEQDNLRIIIQKLIQNDIVWMKAQDILVGDKGSFWIINYGLFEKNEFNRLTRGLVVQKPDDNFSGDVLDLIRSFPFTRFFNQKEPEADQIDLNNAEMLEKLDGTMVGVFFPNGLKDPHWHTRKMLSSHQPDMDLSVDAFTGGLNKLMQIIGQYVKSLNFSEEDVYHTYVFEFIHHSSTVLTKYNESQWGLYLLAGRNLNDHVEEDESNLDKIAERIGAPRPQRWDAVADSNQIGLMMKEISLEIEDFEGFVFRCRKTGKRIKLKSANYVEKHHMIGELSYRRLIPRVLEGEGDEIISYFPQAKKLVEDIKDRHEECRKIIVGHIESYRQWLQELTRRELFEKVNSEVCDRVMVSLIMKNMDKENLDELVEKQLIELAIISYDKETYAGTQTFRTTSEKYITLLGLINRWGS